MATRSTIGLEADDGTIESIYCHWDGDPSNNGKLLLEYYKETPKIEQLLSLGSISVLAPEIGEQHDFDNPNDGWVVSYGRDRKEEDVESTVSKNREDFLSGGESYNYLFSKEGQWLVSYFDSSGFIPLVEHPDFKEE